MLWWWRRGVLAGVVAAYGVVLLVLVTGPWGWELNRLTVACYAFFRYDVPIAPAWIAPEHYGLLLNVLLFVPLGALGVVATGRPWWVIPVAALTSALIELGQWLWLARIGSTADVVANTAGACLGALAVTLRGRGRWRPAGRPASRRPH